MTKDEALAELRAAVDEINKLIISGKVKIDESYLKRAMGAISPVSGSRYDN